MTPEILAAARDAGGMFVFLAIELTALFLIISYAVGLLQEYVSPARIQAVLGSQNGRGHLAAAFMGALTPFCSCSTIPFLKGLLRARAGFGPMMVFLFSSPLLNPIIIGLFAVTFGLTVTISYFLIALTVSVVAGILLERLGFERYVEPSAYEEPPAAGCASGCAGPAKPESRWHRVWKTTWADFRSVLPFLLGGIAVGALIYGFMPTDFITRYAGGDNLFAIPLAAIIGIPLYIRAEAVIPLSAALAAKGMSLGAVMALIIGSAGASLTEVILLRAIFRTPMIIAFVTVVLTMAVGAGLIYALSPLGGAG